MTHFIAIAAISENRAIGKDGKIPWYIPEDWKHFKETTSGSPIIMGRKTYESIGRPLPGRENIVLTRGDFSAPGITVLHSIEELTSYLQSKPTRNDTPSPTLPILGREWKKDSSAQITVKAFICWGSEIYRLFFDQKLADEVILSRVKMIVEWADTFFPEFESDFILEKSDDREWFTIEYWKRK